MFQFPQRSLAGCTTGDCGQPSAAVGEVPDLQAAIGKITRQQLRRLVVRMGVPTGHSP